MNIKTLIDEGLVFLAKRRDNMGKKYQHSPVGKAKAVLNSDGVLVCGHCNGEIVESNEDGTRVCFRCGRCVS